MYSASSVGSFHTALNDFKLDGFMMRYSTFMPRLYNYCLSLGMEPGKIMPSRAFCSDESQGFPIILIAKQFGTFPFNHGLVGGVVATDRHGPHASHGKDMVIIQASHVGYDPQTKEFGTYRRIQTEDCHHSSNCGKVTGVIRWYQDEYAFACNNIFLEPSDFPYQISINNLLLRTNRKEGIFLDLDQLIARDEMGKPKLIRSLSTARTFEAAPELIKKIARQWPRDKSQAFGNLLTPDLFHFKRDLVADAESQGHLEQNLIDPMPWIVTDPAPALAAAQINTQVEFDRAYRTILKEDGYQDRKLLFIAGLNIDISPSMGQTFPLTKFIPWAAYVQTANGTHSLLEQQELFDKLAACDSSNPRQIDLEAAIADMEEAEEVSISFDFRK
jgi:hypothetical protein